MPRSPQNPSQNSPSVQPQTGSAKTAPNFDRLARPYRWMEYLSFGSALEHTRFHFLDERTGCALTNRRHALILGDGDGRFTARLLARYPDLRAHAIDGSPAMLAALIRRVAAVAASARLTTEAADLRYWTGSAPAPALAPTSQSCATPDLIATHFFLDCLTTAEVEQLARRLHTLAAPDALWLVSEFAIPRSGWMRPLAAALVATLYRAFRWLTGLGPQRLPDYPAALHRAGWQPIASHPHLRGLLVSELWQRRGQASSR